MDIAATGFILHGLGLTLVGSLIAARGGMLTRAQIEERVDSQGRWWDEAPDWVRQDYETTANSLRTGLWFIAAGTTLQFFGTAAALF